MARENAYKRQHLISSRRFEPESIDRVLIPFSVKIIEILPSARKYNNMHIFYLSSLKTEHLAIVRFCPSTNKSDAGSLFVNS